MSPYVAEAWRTWRASVRRPAFLLIASMVLALGVGASAVVFTLIDDVLLKPLPFEDPSRLVKVGPMEDGQARHATPAQYVNLDAVDGLAARGIALQLPTLANVAGHGAPVAVPAMRIDHGLLPVLGVTPMLGRQFTAEEDTPHGTPVVMLTYGFWQTRFAGRPDAIGQQLVIEGIPRTVVGVLPRSFVLDGQRADILTPLGLMPSSSDGSNYTIIGRLAPGRSIDTVTAQVNTHLHAVFDATGDRFWMRRRYGVSDLATTLHAESRPVLSLFLASAALLLLIAVVNLTNLMLLRRLSRAHDIAVRSALGAPASRVALPLLAEGVLVGVCGSMLGMMLATVGLVVLQDVVSPEWTVGGALAPTARSWAFAISLGIVVALSASALGLRIAGRRTGADALREGGRLGAGRESSRLGRILVVAQVSMATALLSTAGVFLHRLYDLQKTPLGFRADGILTVSFAPVGSLYAGPVAMRTLVERLRERVRRIPGVDAATVTTNLPAGAGTETQFNVSIDVPPKDSLNPQYHGIDADFLGTFGIPLLEGRNITEGDRRGGTAVALVSKTFGDRYFGGRPIGKVARITGTGNSVQIVGVVGDTLQMGPGDEPSEILYSPMDQIPDPILDVFRGFEPLRMAIHVRGDPATYRDAVHKAFAEVAPDQPIAATLSMADVIAGTTADVRSNLIIIGIFAGLALLLACSGMYAVMAVAVAAREREFGVRLALGSPRHRLLRMVLRNGLEQVGLGLAVGVALSLAGSGLMRAVLSDPASREVDPLGLAATCMILAAAGLLACLPSAWQASRTPPMRALRGE